MSDTTEKSAAPVRIEFETAPERYRHWRIAVNGPVAELILDVDENAPLVPGYQLKLNSYDLGVDIELADAVQRLRFEYPGVKVVVLKSGKDRVFCAGANIRMLAGSSHAHKVNFCKFTNETRFAIEDASAASGQKYLCVVQGTAAGGGYELALATDYIILADDGNSTVSLPELPLLAVLPGTGGLTRVTDKRKVRRDRADLFCTLEEGLKGKRAADWRIVDQSVPRSRMDAAVADAVKALAAQSDRPGGGARDRADAASARARWRYDAVFERPRRDRPAGPTRDGDDPRPRRRSAGRRGWNAQRGRRVLAAAGVARTRRCAARSAHERPRHRHARVQVAGRSGPRARLRCLPRRAIATIGWRAKSSISGSASSSAST